MMQFVKEKYKNTTYVILILISIFSFFFGFILREDSAGGARIDFQNTWNNQEVFDNYNLKEAIVNTKTSEIKVYINSHLPSSYIINKYLNPFSKNKESFLLSIFIINFFTLGFFYFAIKKKYTKKNWLLLLTFASIVFLSPYFRSSAYWAGMENYGIMMMTISYFFFKKYQETNAKVYYYKKIYIILFSFFSCLCVYFDQKLLIIPLIFLIIFIQQEKNFQNIVIYIFTNFILSLPVISLIYYWGGLISPHDSRTRNFGELYFEQLGYCLTIIFFYFIPYILTNFKIIIEESNKNKKNIVILTSIFFLYLIYLENYPTNYYEWESLGKGWVHKLSNILFDNYALKKFFIYILFYISLIFIFLLTNKNFILKLIICFFCLLSIFILPIFQEYFDPLVFILLTLFYYNNIHMNKYFAILNFFFYLFFLLFSNFYY